MNDVIDPTIKSLAQAIKKQESGTTTDPYNAKGSSGEYGAYQFMPDTWKAWSAKHLGDSNAPMSVENQNRVAYNQIKSWKDQGFNPAQIAAAWNAGEGSLKNDQWKTNIGVNSTGTPYNTPEYVIAVSKNYNEFKNQNITPSQTSQNDTGEVQTPNSIQTSAGQFNYGEMTPTGSEAGTLDMGLPFGMKSGDILKGAAQSAVDLTVSAGGGVLNAASAGARQAGFNAPATPSFPSLVNGGQVAPTGYNEQGQELGPVRTALQAGGTALEAASYLFGAPELKFLASAGKASPILKQLVSGGLKTGVAGAEFGGGESLRTNPEDTISALKNAGIGFGTGALLGVGTAGLGFGANKITGASKNLESRLNAAQGNELEFNKIMQEPEAQVMLKDAGFKSIDDVNKMADESYNTFKAGVENYYKTNNNMARKVTENTSKEDLHTVMEYAAETPFTVKGGKLNTLETSNKILEDQKKVGESMGSILDGMDMAGIDTSLSRQELERAALDELNRIGSTPGGASINKVTALRQIQNMIDNQVGKADKVPMKSQSTLKVASNERYPLDPERSTKEAAGEALGNAIRAHHDAIIARGAETGALDSQAVQSYKDLNAVWGKLDRAAEATDIIAKTTIAPKSPRFLPEIIAGIMSGGYNPLVYWGTQAASHGVLNAMDRAILSTRYPTLGIQATPSTTRGLLNSVEATKSKLAGNIESQTAQKMAAEQSIKDAEALIAKRGLPVTPESNSYELGQDIQMGPTAQSKYKIDTGLPEAKGAPKVYGESGGSAYTPDNQLPTINMAAGGLGLAGAGTGLSMSDMIGVDAQQRAELNNNSTTTLGKSSVNPKTEVTIITKDNPLFSAYDKEIANSEKLVKDKLGIELPKNFIKTLLAQESGFGTNDKKYDKTIGENAWLVGLTDGAKSDVKKRMTGDFAVNVSDINPDTIQGAINNAALYIALQTRVSKGQDKEGHKIINKLSQMGLLKDIESLYKKYNGGGTPNAEKDFKKRLEYINK